MVELNFAIYDQNLDPVNLNIEYSTDNGASFDQAQITPQNASKNMIPSTNHTLFWDSDSDIIDQDIDSVLLRFIPDDGREGSVDSVTSNTFPIYNLNRPPEITQCTSGTPFINGNSGDIQISICGSDNESDSISLHFEYSIDLANFIAISPANLEGPLSELSTGFSTTVTWRSSEDVQDSVTSIYLRIRGFDSKE